MFNNTSDKVVFSLPFVGILVYKSIIITNPNISKFNVKVALFTLLITTYLGIRSFTVVRGFFSYQKWLQKCVLGVRHKLANMKANAIKYITCNTAQKDNDCGIGFNIEQTQFMVFSRCELIQDLLKALLVHLVSLLKWREHCLHGNLW